MATFQHVAWVIAFSQFFSLAVALTTVPLLCSRYLRTERGRRVPVLSALSDSAGRMHDRMGESYGKVLHWAMDHRWVVVSVSLLLFGGSLALAPIVGVELSPQPDEGEIRVDVEMEPGSRGEAVDSNMQQLAGIGNGTGPTTDGLLLEAGGAGGVGAAQVTA